MLKVMNPGFWTTVQDEGRWGYQTYGMPVAGAMDLFAYRAANLLAGNEMDAAVLEMTYTGGTFLFTEDGYAALTGADMGARLNDQAVLSWSGFPVTAGSILQLTFAATGVRAYLAVNGGIMVPEILGSRSTYCRSGIGGFQGRTLQQDDLLALGKSSAERAALPVVLPEDLRPKYLPAITLRVLLGPQEDAFAETAVHTFFSAVYTVGNDADRMGYRLDGPVIKHLTSADIVSDALPLGAVQIPAGGKPIVMMADRQTAGGYTKIATVIGVDLAKLAQAQPGTEVSFMHCTDGEAVSLLQQQKELLQYIQKWKQEQ